MNKMLADMVPVPAASPLRSLSRQSKSSHVSSQQSQQQPPSSRCQPPNVETNANLVAHLQLWSSSNREKVLFQLPGGASLTYGEFERAVQRCGSCLRRQFNVRRGDRVVAQVSKSTNAIALYLATLRIGAVYVPLNTDYRLDEIRYFVENAEPVLFVCRSGDKAQFAELVQTPTNGHSRRDWRLLDEAEFFDRAFDADQCPPPTSDDCAEKLGADDLAAICYTSGTTGRPKGAMITHGNLLSNAKTLCDLWRMHESDVLLHAMPIYHVHGLFVALNTVLMRGASMIFLQRFDVETVTAQLPRCTVMMGVPTYYTRLLQYDQFDRRTAKNIRVFVCGSAPLLHATWREFKERIGHEILERYGMTEGQMVFSNPYDKKRKPGTVGLPLPGVTARVRNDVLEYKGPNLFKGYWRMPERSKEDFTDDGFFISGDLAEFDEDGYLRILGRSKDLVISGGLNVYPKEIENVIDALPGVQESAVIGVPHSDFGEAVVAAVVLEDMERVEEREQQMISQLKAKIAPFKVPKRIFFLSQLPRNIMGKVQKNVLRENYKNAFGS